MNDLRFAIRTLGHQRGFAVVAAVVLGLGIGANTAMFSLMNVLLYKPLAVEQPRQLVRLHSRDEAPGGRYRNFSYPNYVDIRAQQTVFTDLTAFTIGMAGVTEGEHTRRAFTAVVPANYFKTFGGRPVRGRDFLPEEERPGAGVAVTIVSDTFWRRHGSDPALMGRTITLNGRPFEVIGVAPPGFTTVSIIVSPDLYVPLGVHDWLANDFMNTPDQKLSDRNNHCLMLVGRLKSGLRPTEAEAQLEPLAEQLQQAYPKENQGQVFQVRRPSRISLSSNPMDDRSAKGLALLLLPMSGAVLLIACFNLANMVLARGAARQREFAIRAALGGGRLQIIRQLLVEGLVLSFIGGALALVLSSWVTRLMVSSLAAKMSFFTIVFDERPDVRVLGATFVCCLLAALVSTLMPAWRLSKVDVMHDLRDSGGEGRRARRGIGLFAPRNVLVMGQVALSFVLLAAAGLFFRGAWKAAQANPGFRFEQGLLVELDGSLAGYNEAKSRAVYRDVLERVRRVPGVNHASLASSVSFGVFNDGREIQRPGISQRLRQGEEIDDADQAFFANYVIVSDDYFRSLGTPILRGREFERLDLEPDRGARVAILNEVAARRLWPNEEAIGRQIEILERDPEREPLVLEVVGIAPSFKSEVGDPEPEPYLYVPLGQAFQSWVNLHVRLDRPDLDAERAMLGAVRAALREVDANLPVLSLNTLRDFHNGGVSLWMYRAAARLFLAFAALALTLAVVGVYGVKAFVVAQRTREIGIRIALGGTRRQVLWMILRDGLKLAAVGLGLGLVLALGVGQLIRSMLFGVSGVDPLSFGTALIILATAALCAAYFPARRAARVDPIVALRYE